MSIFGKHIFRSIRRSPLQSLLIVLTLIIATAASVVSLKTFLKIRERLTEDEGIDNYVSDITVKLSSGSDLRILFEDDLKSVVKDRAKILGEFALDGVCESGDGRDFIKFAAADLKNADAFYKFKFKSYGSFTAENYKKSIIVSTDLAEKYGLSVGDNFSFLLLNQTFNFTVQAIALPEGPLFEYGGIFSIDAVREELAKANPAIHSFGENFVPFSILRVRVNDKDKINEVFEDIIRDERFSDKRVFKNADDVGNFDYYTTVSIFITAVASLLLIGLSAVVISSSLDMIRKKRSKDTALFVLSGAERGHLNKMLYLEGLIYSVLGLFGGVAFASQLYKYVNNALQWSENGLKSGAVDWLFATIISPVIMLVSTFIHLHKERQRTSYEIIMGSASDDEKRGAARLQAVSFTVLFLSLAAVFLLPVKARLVLSVISMFLAILCVFFISPIAFRGVSAAVIGVMKRRDRMPSLSILTYKNIHASYPLMRIARLITLLLVIIFVIFFSVFSVKDQIDMFENIAECDYIALGADEGCDEVVKKDETVLHTFRINLVDNVKTEHGGGVICVSADESALPYIHERAKPKELPRGDKAAISIGLAKFCGANVGDSITLDVDGEDYSFTVSEVLKIQSAFAFIDANYIGRDNDKLAIVTRDGYSDEEKLALLSAMLAPRGAGVVRLYEITGKASEFSRTMVNYLYIIAHISILTALIGVFNLILSGHNSRKQEFKVLYLSGFTKGRVLTLEIYEVLTVVVLSVLLALPLGFAVSGILDSALNSFGADFLH